jgi:cell division protein FtsW
VFTAAGFAAMLLAALLDYRVFAWRRSLGGWVARVPVLLAAVLLAAAWFMPGAATSRMGAARSIVLYDGAFTLGFQPAELAKIALVIWMAARLTRPGYEVRHLWRGFAPVVGMSAILIGLTGIADLGTAALMGVVMMAVLALAGARWVHLGLMTLLGLLGGVGLILMEPFRVQRIVTFFSDQPDTSGEGYQITQALIAIGSGGWFGRGLGAGFQKYGYLPQDNNDFILAIVCEELGVIGGAAVVVLFLALLWRGWRLSATAGDPFGRLLAGGLTLLICLQAAFNVGVVTHSIPTKGISLPFVSAGGSGVVFLGAAAGLLAAVGRHCRSSSAET